ncbi:MAG: MBL fold metallo-hydrolase [Lachnospiraceae bacterium]|nr:MBL fold metallo-hydrolase [Lachnospiraceae bacterium]
MGQLCVNWLSVGVMQTNCYLISHPETKELILVDPGEEAERIQHEIEKNEWKPVVILLTHGHFDHMGAAELLRKWNSIPVYCYEGENDLIEKPESNLSAMFGNGFSCTIDGVFRDQEVLSYLGENITVIHTPGHTQGSCCLYFAKEGFLLSGDTLFSESVGRTDFPTGNSLELKQSVLKLYQLPEETIVYPGHYEETTIRHEKRHNSFVLG